MCDIEGYGRTQRLLLPDLLDDDVTEAHPIRFRDVSVERLDLVSLGFVRAHAAFTGRPAYDPRDVLTLYIYGDLNRIRSSRRLVREPHCHVELIWLLRQRRPDVKTMADCRNHHPNARPALFREFVRLCRQWDRFGAARLASDGSPCKPVNNPHKHFTQATLEQALKDIDAKVEQSWRDLDAAAREESRVYQPTSEALQQTIARRQERQQRYRGLVQAITTSGATQLSLTDPESRARPKSPTGDGGDNV
jgi:transposase